MRANPESIQPVFFPICEAPELLPATEKPMVIQTPLEAAASPVIIAEENGNEGADDDDLLKQPVCYQKNGCDKACRAAGFCMGVGEG